MLLLLPTDWAEETTAAPGRLAIADVERRAVGLRDMVPLVPFPFDSFPLPAEESWRSRVAGVASPFSTLLLPVGWGWVFRAEVGVGFFAGGMEMEVCDVERDEEVAVIMVLVAAAEDCERWRMDSSSSDGLRRRS